MFRSAHADNKDWEAAVQSCANQIAGNKEANFGFVYMTEPLAPHLDRILHALRLSTGIESWVGSVGMGICTITQSFCGEFFNESAISIMTAQLPAESFILFPNSSYEEHGSLKISQAGITDYTKGMPFVLAHADAVNPEYPTLVEGLANSTEGFVVGGLTTSGTQNHQVSGSVTGGSISGVVFTPAVEIVTSLSQGCQPMGKPHRIDQCSENLIIKLDGRSTLEVLLDETGATDMVELQKMANYIHVALLIAGSDTRDYLVRNLIGVDENNGIVAIDAPVKDGEELMFVRRDSAAALSDMKAGLERLKIRSGDKIKGGLYIACIARGPHMFGSQNAEIELIRDIIGNIPLVGMYANGEISNKRLYSYTGILNLFI